jgi:hypothetical protein
MQLEVNARPSITSATGQNNLSVYESAHEIASWHSQVSAWNLNDVIRICGLMPDHTFTSIARRVN